MRYSLLGRTGVKVSRLSLGTMAFGGDATPETAAAMVTRVREAGLNFIDTADVYNKGRSEEILGGLLRGWRDEVVLATKAYFPTGEDRNARGASRFHLVRAVEASLRRLATDRVDVYYLHRFDDDTALEETLRALDDLVRQGKILYPACSNFAAWQVAHALGIAAARAGGLLRHPAHVQPRQAAGRGRDPAHGKGARRRGRAVQPDGRRPADGQIRGWREA